MRNDNLLSWIKRLFRRVAGMYEDFYNMPNKNKLAAELYEIAEKIASGKPPINADDIIDFFVELIKQEKKSKRPSRGRKKKTDDKKKDRKANKRNPNAFI